MKISRSTIQGIDFLRFLFSLLVLIAHSIEATKDYSNRILAETLGEWTHWIAPGGFWVGGFFVLSGFCIGLSVFRSIERNTYSPALFCLQRVTRIYPMYLVGLGLSVGTFFILGGGPFPLDAFLANVFCLQGFVSEPFPHFEPSWSIAYEMFYYALVPLLLIGARSNIRVFFLRALVLMLAASVLFGGIWKLLLNEAGWMIPMWTVPWSGLLWLVGFSGVAFPELRKLMDTHLPGIKALLGGVLILSACYCYRTYALFNDLPAFLRLGLGPVVGVGFLFVVLWLEKSEMFGTLNIERCMSWGGLLSYPLYLLHMPIQHLVGYVFLDDMEFPSLVYCLFLVVIPLVICGTLGVLMEKGFLAWRARFLQSPNVQNR